MIALALENFIVSYLSGKLLQSGFKNPVLKHMLGQIVTKHTSFGISWKTPTNLTCIVGMC